MCVLPPKLSALPLNDGKAVRALPLSAGDRVSIIRYGSARDGGAPAGGGGRRKPGRGALRLNQITRPLLMVYAICLGLFLRTSVPSDGTRPEPASSSALVWLRGSQNFCYMAISNCFAKCAVAPGGAAALSFLLHGLNLRPECGTRRPDAWKPVRCASAIRHDHFHPFTFYDFKVDSPTVLAEDYLRSDEFKGTVVSRMHPHNGRLALPIVSSKFLPPSYYGHFLL
ncbi:hypothetical protein EVAR_36729_1 [Eumeta japonica]|uniref:Uncharacterized protein n=1 Tax=Eumeta variegata TaxID=151549 RepID=A0A4C1X268_EUMVA|nr:hypothetical protein EVAR_36729_1 [Eumeta japonica]